MVEVISYSQSPLLGYLQFAVPSMLSARQGVAHSIDLVGSPDGNQGGPASLRMLIADRVGCLVPDAALLCSARTGKRV